MTDEEDLIRTRQIRFRGPHPEGDQAPGARAQLADLEGVLDVTPLGRDGIEVTYHLADLSFEMIEALLQELGYHLDNSLLFKLKRALYYYSEDCQRMNLGIDCEKGLSCCARILASRYRRRGQPDALPPHWRRYL